MRTLRRLMRGLFPHGRHASNQGVWFAGRFFTWQEIARHWLFLGGTGRGKTFASEMLIEQYMRQGCSMVCTCVKMDDFDRIVRIAERAGQAHRILELTPKGPHKQNLIESLLAPGDAFTSCAQMLTMVGEVGSRSGSGGENAKFWEKQTERALIASIIACKEVVGKISLADVHDVIATTPPDHAALKQPEWDAHKAVDDRGDPIVRGRCAQVLLEGYKRKLHETSPAFKNASGYLMNEMPGGGDRMRGGIVAGVSNILGNLLYPPYLEAMGTDTTMTARRIDEGNHIAILNAPILTDHTPALLWQFAWTLDAQLHCLRRTYEKGTPPFIICRDEVGWLMVSGEWEAKVALVARSAGLSFLDIVQDVDSLLMALAGKENAAYAFASNHAHLLLFGSSNASTNKYASNLIDTHKVLNFSGGSGGGRCNSGNVADDVFGVPNVNWSQNLEPIFKEQRFAQLPVGVGVLLSDGIPKVVDFRR